MSTNGSVNRANSIKLLPANLLSSLFFSLFFPPLCTMPYLSFSRGGGENLRENKCMFWSGTCKTTGRADITQGFGLRETFFKKLDVGIDFRKS